MRLLGTSLIAGNRNMKISRETAVREQISLHGERARLVRLCAQLTGNPDAAEDLAQDALVEAWRHADKLRDPEAWRPWLSGIARNVCLRWHRSHGREMSRLARPESPWLLEEGTSTAAAAAATSGDIEESLERSEITRMLDRAMGALPAQTRALLVGRYVEDLSPSELAARAGLSENTAAVRLHRGKQALRRVLTTDFREDAVAYGLVDAEEWQETRIWCPRCGERRLEGRFVVEGEKPFFRVRCSRCDRALGADFTTFHRSFDVPSVLGDVKGYKPALNRVSAWWNAHFRCGLSTGAAPCPRCGRPAKVRLTAPDSASPLLKSLRGIYTPCAYCGATFGVTPSGLAFSTPEVQQFWRRHPRMRLLAERDLHLEGRLAVRIHFEDVTAQASIDVIFARDNFQLLQVQASDSP